MQNYRLLVRRLGVISSIAKNMRAGLAGYVKPGKVNSKLFLKKAITVVRVAITGSFEQKQSES